MARGDLRGDNVFVCDDDRYPDGSLCIGWQLLFCGPVLSNLDYLMSTDSVRPELPDHLQKSDTEPARACPSDRAADQRERSTPGEGRAAGSWW